MKTKGPKVTRPAKADLNPKLRAEKEQAARNDKRRKWFMKTDLELVERFLNVSLRDGIRNMLLSRRRQVRVLDLGCGYGITLRGLKKEFGKEIETYGLTATRLGSQSYRGVDHLLVGHALEVKPAVKFDLIYSHIGPPYHSERWLDVVEKTVGWLEPGGVAILQVKFGEGPSVNSLVAQPAIRELLESKGIKSHNLFQNVLSFKKP